MTIDISQPLAHDEGFPRVPNIMYRMYPLLDDFTVETTGFYGYLRSWRQNNPEHRMYGKTWLNQSEMAAQSGLSPYKIRKHIDTLLRYDLLRAEKSNQVANKRIYECLEPLTEAEFRARYPEVIERFGERLGVIETELAADRHRLREKQQARSAGVDDLAVGF